MRQRNTPPVSRKVPIHVLKKEGERDREEKEGGGGGGGEERWIKRNE